MELVDNSTTTTDKLATIVVSVFGTGKVEQLKHVVGKLMAFFNLSVVCAGRGSSPQINNYNGELMEPAPECEKTASLRDKQQDLAAAGAGSHPCAVMSASTPLKTTALFSLLAAPALTIAGAPQPGAAAGPDVLGTPGEQPPQAQAAPQNRPAAMVDSSSRSNRSSGEPVRFSCA